MTEEDSKLFSELRDRCKSKYENEQTIEINDVLGFKLAETRCYIPQVKCGSVPARLMSLVPVYQTVFLPISSSYWPHKGQSMLKIKDDPTFKLMHDLTPGELAILAEKGRVIPYFADDFKYYDERTIRPLLQPGLPRISRGTMMAVRNVAIVNVAGKTADWEVMQKSAAEDIQNLGFPQGKSFREMCTICLSVCYSLGMREAFKQPEFGFEEACLTIQAVSVELFDAVLKAECPIAEDVLTKVGMLPEGIDLEYVLKGLKIDYSPKVPLEDYADVFDGKTSKAIREILANLLKDPMSRKYRERMSAKIFDLNQQVDEIAKSRTAKVFETISDMTLYGGSKFIESQTDKLVRIPKKGLVRLGEWLASKGVDLTAKTQRKDWSIAQLYKAQCQLKKYK
jgi:hypothetical protein